MTTGAVDTVFLDTNILVYATIAEAPLHLNALRTIQTLEQAGTDLWISRQILREYLATLTRPQLWMNPIPVQVATTQIRVLENRFHMAADNHQVTARLLELAEQIPIGGRQVHDANIVATMLVYGVRTLVTHNVVDFNRFAHLITIMPLNP